MSVAAASLVVILLVAHRLDVLVDGKILLIISFLIHHFRLMVVRVCRHALIVITIGSVIKFFLEGLPSIPA